MKAFLLWSELERKVLVVRALTQEEAIKLARLKCKDAIMMPLDTLTKQIESFKIPSEL
jgi:hypothetical protein